MNNPQGTFVSLPCDELKGPIQAPLSPAEPSARQGAPFLLLGWPWALGSRMLSAAIPVNFCSRADLVQFSWMFARLTFNLVLANRELRERSRLQMTLGCLNKKTKRSELPQGDGDCVSSQLVFTFYRREFTFRPFLRQLFGILV